MTSHIISNFFIIFLLAIEFLIFIYFILSPLGRISKFINGVMVELKIVTDPVLNPFRFLLKKSIFYSNKFDFSPVVAFLVLEYTVLMIKSFS